MSRSTIEFAEMLEEKKNELRLTMLKHCLLITAVVLMTRVVMILFGGHPFSFRDIYFFVGIAIGWSVVELVSYGYEIYAAILRNRQLSRDYDDLKNSELFDSIFK